MLTNVTRYQRLEAAQQYLEIARLSRATSATTSPITTETAQATDKADKVIQTADETAVMEASNEVEEAPEVNTSPNQIQYDKINLFNNYGFSVQSENITMLEDGSVQLAIKNKTGSDTVIVIDNKGKIVSAQNANGFMLINCLYENNSEVLKAIYEIAPDGGDDKLYNYYNGFYRIEQDENGNTVIYFDKKFDKPSDETASSASSVTLTPANVGGASYQGLEPKTTGKEKPNKTSITKVVISKDGTVNTTSYEVTEEKAEETGVDEPETAVEEPKNAPQTAETTEETTQPETAQEEQTVEETAVETEAKEPETAIEEPQNIPQQEEIRETTEDKATEKTPTEKNNTMSDKSYAPTEIVNFLKENNYIQSDDNCSIKTSDDFITIEFENGSVLKLHYEKDEANNISANVSSVMFNGRNYSYALVGVLNMMGVNIEDFLTSVDSEGNSLYTVQEGYYSRGRVPDMRIKNNETGEEIYYNGTTKKAESATGISSSAAREFLCGYLTQDQFNKIEIRIKELIYGLLNNTEGEQNPTNERINELYETDVKFNFNFTAWFLGQDTLEGDVMVGGQTYHFAFETTGFFKDKGWKGTQNI